MSAEPAPTPVTVEKLLVAFAWVADDAGVSAEDTRHSAALVMEAWRNVANGVERRSDRPFLTVVT